jgi:hypothetical protein
MSFGADPRIRLFDPPNHENAFELAQGERQKNDRPKLRTAGLRAWEHRTRWREPSGVSALLCETRGLRPPGVR